MKQSQAYQMATFRAVAKQMRDTARALKNTENSDFMRNYHIRRLNDQADLVDRYLKEFEGADSV